MDTDDKKDRPASPIIPEDGIKWRIESPPNRHNEEREKTAKSNGNGINKEDSILIDDPVTPWFEDEYDTSRVGIADNSINSTSKANNNVKVTTKTVSSSSSSNIVKSQNVQNKRVKNINDKNEMKKNVSKSQNVKNKSRNSKIENKLSNATAGKNALTKPDEIDQSSPPSSPIIFKQPNITSHVNLSPKITETLKSESPTSEIRKLSVTNGEKYGARSSSPPVKYSRKKTTGFKKASGGIDGEHSGILISNRNNMGTKRRKKNLEKQPNKYFTGSNTYSKTNNVTGLMGRPLQEWYEKNVLDGYSLAVPSTDSLALSEDAFLVEEEHFKRINDEINGGEIDRRSPSSDSKTDSNNAFRRLPISQSNVELYSQMHLSIANGKTEDGGEI